jgi:hypothetical protein
MLQVYTHQLLLLLLLLLLHLLTLPGRMKGMGLLYAASSGRNLLLSARGVLRMNKRDICSSCASAYSRPY